jgi:hypothetical protein
LFGAVADHNIAGLQDRGQSGLDISVECRPVHRPVQYPWRRELIDAHLPSDEVIMVAGTRPMRAKKARYFEDAQFEARILVPPVPKTPETGRTDDWSARPLPPHPDTADPAAQADEDEAGDTQHEKRKQAELDQARIPDTGRPMDNEFEPGLNRPSDDRAAHSTTSTVPNSKT